MNNLNDYSGRCQICFGNPFYLLLNRHYHSKHYGQIVPPPSQAPTNHIQLNQINNNNDSNAGEDIYYNNDIDDNDDMNVNDNGNHIAQNDQNLDHIFQLVDPVPPQLPILQPAADNLVYFDGLIPSELQRYHLQHPDIRQSESVLAGLCNPPNGEYSQYYVKLQEIMMKEVFHIDDMYTALVSGSLEDFIKAVKYGFDNRNNVRNNEEMYKELHCLFDESNTSDLYKRKWLLFLVKYGLDVPHEPTTIRNHFLDYMKKVLPPPTIEKNQLST